MIKADLIFQKRTKTIAALLRTSVIVATHNRASYLKKALASLARQTIAPAEREIIVVLSACTDESKSMLETEFEALPGLSVLEEPEPGASLARNIGIQAASGKAIAFLDDDAMAPEGWLEEVANKLEAAPWSVAACGGPVVPVWEAPKPDWLPRSLEQFLTIVDHGPTERHLRPFEYLVGANMAFKASLLKEAGCFPTDLDRVRCKLLSNGDLYPQDVLRSNGYSILYDPNAPVWHHVVAGRLTAEWFWERGFWQGYSDWVMGTRFNSGRRLIKPRRLVRGLGRALEHPLDFTGLIGGPRITRVESQFRARWLLGYVAACLRNGGSVPCD